MATKCISYFDKFINKYSRYGKMKNRIYKNLEKRGLSYITQRKAGYGRCVILGSKDQYSRTGLAMKLDKRKGYIEEETSIAKLQYEYKENTTLVKKYFDLSGNLKKTYSKIRRYDVDKFDDFGNVVRKLTGTIDETETPEKIVTKKSGIFSKAKDKAFEITVDEKAHYSSSDKEVGTEKRHFDKNI